MKLKVIGLVGALILAAPVAATAAPASGLTAHSYVDMTSAPIAAFDAVAPGDATAKIEKVWWRGGWRGRGFGWRGGWGWRRPFVRYGRRRPFVGYYGWHRPYWRRRWFY